MEMRRGELNIGKCLLTLRSFFTMSSPLIFLYTTGFNPLPREPDLKQWCFLLEHIWMIVGVRRDISLKYIHSCTTNTISVDQSGYHPTPHLHPKLLCFPHPHLSRDLKGDGALGSLIFILLIASVEMARKA